MAVLRRDEYVLRPIEERDLDTVLGWRNSERIRYNMYTDHEITLDEHREWFARLQKEPVPTFMIFEYQGRPIGVIQVTQIDGATTNVTGDFTSVIPEHTREAGQSWGFSG